METSDNAARVTSPTEPARPNARIEAALDAVMEFVGANEVDPVPTATQWFETIVAVALAAADAVESSDAEKLREALRAARYELRRISKAPQPGGSHGPVSISLAAIAHIDAALAISESVRSPESPAHG